MPEEHPKRCTVPSTSLIILTYNNLDYTRLCLESVFNRTTGITYEVILVDNGSQDDTPSFLRYLAGQHDNLHIFLNQENMGFAHGINQGAAFATGEYLVFLNNDVLVTDSWLSRLIDHLANPTIGMVGPVTNASGNQTRIPVSYPALPLRCSLPSTVDRSPLTVDSPPLLSMQAFAEQYTMAHRSQAFETDMLPLLCVALRRSVFEEVGPLDERFGIGLFEDEDYALRLKQKGYHLLCAEDVFVHHWGSASFADLGMSAYWSLFEENRKKLEEKWGITWQPHPYRNELIREQLAQLVNGTIEYSHMLTERDQIIAERDQQVESLLNQVGSLSYQLEQITTSIATSKAWRFARFLQRLRAVLIPPGSSRESILLIAKRLFLWIARPFIAGFRWVSNVFLPWTVNLAKRGMLTIAPRRIRQLYAAFQHEYALVDRSQVTLFAAPDILTGYTPRRDIGSNDALYRSSDALNRPERSTIALVKVSLIVTVKDEAPNVKPWIKSLLAQTRKPDEVVICDGGSQDGTLELLKEMVENLAKDSPPINLKIISSPGANISKGRNIAVQHASYPVIACTDFGCSLDPGWLELLIRPFELDPHIQVSCGYYQAILNDGVDRLFASFFMPDLSRLDPQTFLPSSRSLAYRKELWAQVNGYPEWMTDAGEDTLFDYMLKSQPTRWAFVPQAKVYWQAPRSMFQLYKTFYRYSRGDGESGLFATTYWHKMRLLLRSLAWLIFGLLLVILAVVLSKVLSQSGIYGSEGFARQLGWIIVTILALALVIRWMIRVLKVAKEYQLSIWLALKSVWMRWAVNVAQLSGFTTGVSNRTQIIQRKTDYYLPQLLDILATNPDRKGIVIYPPTHDWGFMFQRPQQIARAFAKLGYLYFYCTDNERTDSVFGFRKLEPNLYLCHVPTEVFGKSAALYRSIERPIVYIGSPWHRKIVYGDSSGKNTEGVFNKPCIIYDHYDDLEVSSGRLEDHLALLKHADIVLTTSQLLLEKTAKQRPDTLFVTNGVDDAFIQLHRPKPQQKPPPDWIKVTPKEKPVIGYSGALAEWFDYDLLTNVAKKRTDLEFVLIGVSYDGSIERSRVLSLVNIHWLGMKPYEELFNYIWLFDVGMIPFKVNQITEATSPIKQFEYMACGKPVVSTAIPECRRYPEIFIAEDMTQFSDLLDSALKARSDPAYLSRIGKIARQNTWEQRVQIILDKLATN